MEEADNWIKAIEEKAGEKEILVIGDIMIDEYHYCKAERKTPEGPFMIWDLDQIERRLGGAGNIAHNLKALGAEVTVAGIALGGEIEQLAADSGIRFVLERDGRHTTVKRRFMDCETKMLLAREDIESREPVSRETASFIRNRLKKKFDMVIYSDYNKGMLNKDTVAEFMKISADKRMADVKPANARLFTGKVDVIKMNFREFQKFVEEYKENVKNEDEDVARAGRIIRDDLKADLLITRSEKGMSYIGKEIIHLKTEAKEIADIVGAGDAVTAGFAVAIACGLDANAAVYIANMAAAIEVSKRGAVPVAFDEIKRRAVVEEKIVSENSMKKIASRLKTVGKKLVFTNGCFDVLHHGHIHFLNAAKAYGDILVVGLNSDSSVRKLKGEGRPKIHEHGRAEMLAALPAVDYIVIFSTDTPEYLVEMLKPDIYVKGKDYTIEQLPEARIVSSYGGKVKLVDIITEEGKKVSSTDIIKGKKEQSK